MQDQLVLVLIGTGILVAACLAIIVHAYRNVFESLQAGERVARLGHTFGGAVLGTQQWISQRGAGSAGLLIVSGKTGINRVSVWSTRLALAGPRMLLGVVIAYDEPLRRAFDAGEVDRIALRRRSRWSGWMHPSARAQRVLGDLAPELSFSSTANDDAVAAILALPEIRQRVRGALAVGFDELILYPPHGGVELVAYSPRIHIVDPEIVHAALSWIEPIVWALGRVRQ